jgi:hypothetical protein
MCLNITNSAAAPRLCFSSAAWVQAHLFPLPQHSCYIVRSVRMKLLLLMLHRIAGLFLCLYLLTARWCLFSSRGHAPRGAHGKDGQVHTIVQFDGSMSSGTVLDDDDRFAGLDRLPLVAPDGTAFTLADITGACKAHSDAGNESTPIARPVAAQLLAPPGHSDDPAARLNPAMLANQVWTI